MKLRFYFPDSQDQIDPTFDFDTETGSDTRIRQRDDLYAHEALARAPYDGVLVSKTMVDGTEQAGGKYTVAQRERLYRTGAHAFYRLNRSRPLDSMADCGGFSYVREELPPYTVDEVIDFYDGCDFDFGISVDHVILGFNPEFDAAQHDDPVATAWRQRQEVTLQLAAEFWNRCRVRRCRFVPMGVAQGWSPDSYQKAVQSLQSMGYRYVALGGLVPLKTPEILRSLDAVASVRLPDTYFHLLGISRSNFAATFASRGVASFDSTSPFRQAFKDSSDNFYTLDGHYMAVRVPQVDGNTRLKMTVRAGRVSQQKALNLERACLRSLRQYGRGQATVETALDAVAAYTELTDDSRSSRLSFYRQTLEAQPWRQCDCGLCEQVGIEIAIFRGAERNKRRGFHNLHVFRRRLERDLRERLSVADH